MCIELVRQFYDLPRQLRIVGEYGAQQFVSYTNSGIKPQHQGFAFGQDMGYRKPVFDIKVSAQKRNVYTKVSQNELALQFFQMGFFNPQMVDQALMCLDMMEFDGKDDILQKVAKNGTMFQKLLQYMQMALTFAQSMNPQLADMIAQDIMATMSGGGTVPAMSATAQLTQADPIKGLGGQEPTHVQNARKQSDNAAQPKGGDVVARKENKK
jgi:hypothetical protein